MATAKDARPVFGPPVTPAMFNLKWTRKVAALAPIKNAPDTEQITPSKVIAVFQHQIEFMRSMLPVILHCSREARSIGLQAPTPYHELEQTMKSAPRSTCEGIEIFRGHCKFIVENWEQAKRGKLLLGVLAWQQAPLKLRREANELIVEWNEMESEGLWDVNGEVKEATWETAKEVNREDGTGQKK